MYLSIGRGKRDAQYFDSHGHYHPPSHYHQTPEQHQKEYSTKNPHSTVHHHPTQNYQYQEYTTQKNYAVTNDQIDYMTAPKYYHEDSKTKTYHSPIDTSQYHQDKHSSKNEYAIPHHNPPTKDPKYDHIEHTTEIAHTKDHPYPSHQEHVSFPDSKKYHEEPNYHTTKKYDAKSYQQPSYPETSYSSNSHHETPTYSEPNKSSYGHHSPNYPTTRHPSHDGPYPLGISHHETNTNQHPTYKHVDYYPAPDAMFKVRIRTRQDYSCCKRTSPTGVCEEILEECNKLKVAGKSVSCNQTRFT